MNCLRSLERWDRGFESHSRHGCLCAFILCLNCPVCRQRPCDGLITRPRAYSAYSTNCCPRRRARPQNSSHHSVIFVMWTRVPSPVQGPASQLNRRVPLAAGYAEVVCGETPLRVALHSSWLPLPTPQPHLSSSYLPIFILKSTSRASHH
jgi:hypothetical protein